MLGRFERAADLWLQRLDRFERLDLLSNRERIPGFLHRIFINNFQFLFEFSDDDVENQRR